MLGVSRRYYTHTHAPPVVIIPRAVSQLETPSDAREPGRIVLIGLHYATFPLFLRERVSRSFERVGPTFGRKSRV